MSPSRLATASLLILGLVPAAASAQTADGSLTPPPGLAGTPPRVSRTRIRAVKPDSTLPTTKMQTLPKLTAAERAEKRKLDHDLKICIGC